MTNARRVEKPVFCGLLTGRGELSGIGEGIVPEDEKTVAARGGPAMTGFCTGIIGMGVAGGPDTLGLGEYSIGTGVTGGLAGMGTLEGGVIGASTLAGAALGASGGGTTGSGASETARVGADGGTASFDAIVALGSCACARA
jgi:hypothetical protein